MREIAILTMPCRQCTDKILWCKKDSSVLEYQMLLFFMSLWQHFNFNIQTRWICHVNQSLILTFCDMDFHH